MQPLRTPAAADPDALRHAQRAALAELREARRRPLLIALRVVVFGLALPLSMVGATYAGWHWGWAEDGGLERSRRAFARAAIESVRPELAACADVEGIARAPVAITVHAFGAGVYAVVESDVSNTVRRCVDDVAQRVALVSLRFPTAFPLELRPKHAALVRVIGVRGPAPLSANERARFFQVVREVGSCAALRRVTTRFALTSGPNGFAVTDPQVDDCVDFPAPFASDQFLPYFWWVDPAVETTAPLQFDVSRAVSELLVD